MRILLILFYLINISLVFAQPRVYTTANAHSHNDYEQQKPFHTAFENGFGSIEADIHLAQGKILVGHDAKDLDEKRSIESLYLLPLSKIKKIKKPLQLLIDIKTEAISTLDALMKILQEYPEIINSANIRLVISGNRPSEMDYEKYPSYIWFDGRLDKTYSADQLKKIALLSDDFGKFTKWKKIWPMNDDDRAKIESAIEKAHSLNKPVRLWGSPDFAEAWSEMKKLKVDFINTDKIEELSTYLKKQ